MSDDAATDGTDSTPTGRSHLDQLVDELLDRFLFAPVALMASPDDARALADKGRTLIRNQTTMARFIGQIAVTSATRKVKAKLDEQRSAGRQAPDAAAATPTAATPTAATPTAKSTPKVAPASAPTAAAAQALPIDGYDTLAASQIVPLLRGLSPAQLDAVESHELAGRNRKTVLNRIHQLR